MLKTKVKPMSISRLIQDSIAKSSFKKELLKIFFNQKRRLDIYYEKKKIRIFRI